MAKKLNVKMTWINSGRGIKNQVCGKIKQLENGNLEYRCNLNSIKILFEQI
jgi:hypothetical protein